MENLKPKPITAYKDLNGKLHENEQAAKVENLKILIVKKHNSIDDDLIETDLTTDCLKKFEEIGQMATELLNIKLNRK